MSARLRLYWVVLFTPLWFWGLRREFENTLVSGRVFGGRVFAAGLALSIDRDGEQNDLILWLDPRYPRAECLPTRRDHELPERWSALANARCTAVRQPNSDRRLEFEFETARGTCLLQYFGFTRPAVRLTPPDETTNIDLGGRVPSNLDINLPFVLDVEDPSQHSGDSPEKVVRGLDRFWVEAAGARGGWAWFPDATRALADAPPQAYLVKQDDRPIGVSLVDFGRDLTSYQFEPTESLSRASSELVFFDRRTRQRQETRREALDTITEMRRRLRRRLKELESDQRRQQDHALWREGADWLLAQLSQVKQGQTELVVPGAEGERTVSLDPALKPHEQAERWYQHARRMRRGLQTTETRLSETRDKLKVLEALLENVRDRLDAEDEASEAAWNELSQAVQRAPRRRTVRVSQPPSRFRRFRSPGGLAIWVGRNNKENDELSLHAAHKEDLWFHAQQAPGSHVVLRSHALKQTPAMMDIVAAASTAAYFSRARGSAKVPVIYTRAKYVRKPRKAAPGKVVVEREKSIMVEPGIPPTWDEGV